MPMRSRLRCCSALCSPSRRAIAVRWPSSRCIPGPTAPSGSSPAPRRRACSPSIRRSTVDDMRVLIDAFGKKYGVKLQFWRASSESILRRALIEQRAGRYDVDAIETSAAEMESLHREGMLQEVRSPHLADIVPAALRPHREWVGDRLNIIAAGYNTKLVRKDELPKTLRGLRRSALEGAARHRIRRRRLVRRARQCAGRGQGRQAVPRHGARRTACRCARATRCSPISWSRARCSSRSRSITTRPSS